MNLKNVAHFIMLLPLLALFFMPLSLQAVVTEGRSTQADLLAGIASVTDLPGIVTATDSEMTAAITKPDQPRLVVPSDTILELDLEEVIISAQRTPVRHSDVRRSVQVIDRREIRETSARDLPALLSGVRSVDIRSRGTFGMQSDISIRGGTFDQTLILLNGVNVTDPQTGHHNLNVPVDLQSIERIEVLHGPGARIFGPNAFNGAINIITREPGDTGISASLTGGQHRFGSAGIATGFAIGPVSHHISVNAMTSDGFVDNTDFRTGNLFYRSQVKAGPGKLDLQTGYNQKAFGANSFYSPRFPDQYEETRAGFASLQWQPEGSLRLTPAVYWRRHHDRFELFRYEAPEWYAGHNYHRTDIVGGSLNWVHTSRFGTTSAGFDYRFEHIYSNVLGEDMDEPVQVPGYDDAWFTHSYERSGISLMVEQSAMFGSFSLSGGTLIYSNSDLDEPFTFFPGIDLGWQIHDHWRWYTTANRTLRLPTFTDLFYSGPDNLGNLYLEPEEAVSVETGVKSLWRGVQADVALFHRWGMNMIDWIREPGDEVWRSENLTEVNVFGVEAGVIIPLEVFGLAGPIRSRNHSQSQIQSQRQQRNQSLSRNQSPHQSPSQNRNQNRNQKPAASDTGNRTTSGSLSIQYAYLHADKFSGEMLSNYALDHLNHKLDISLRIPLTSRTGFRTSAILQDRAGSYMLFEEDEFVGTRRFEPFWMVDIKVWFDAGPVRLFGETSNLFDTQYFDIANVPQPGRWVRAGLNVTL